MNPNIIIKEIINLLKTEPWNTIFWAGFWATLVTNIFSSIFNSFGGNENV